jgi:hypothetical protein
MQFPDMTVIAGIPPMIPSKFPFYPQLHDKFARFEHFVHFLQPFLNVGQASGQCSRTHPPAAGQPAG